MELYFRLILYIIFGVLPSLIWLFYYLKQDLHPEPKKMIIKIFLCGVLVTIPVFFIQVALYQLLTQIQFIIPSQLIFNILKWFFIIALTEEFFKYFVVKSIVLKSYELDEPLDIMLYMIISALGFAALENILYLFSPVGSLSFDEIIRTTITVSFIRFIGATFLHTLCSGILGYFLAVSFFKNKKIMALTGISLAVFLHGLYNFSIMTLESPFNFLIPIAIIVTMALFLIFDFNRIKKLKSVSLISPNFSNLKKIKK